MHYVVRPLGAWTLPITEDRKSSGTFRASWDRTLRDLDYELACLGASNVVFAIDVAEGDIRLDGMLRADARVDFPGVKLHFDSMWGPLVYATDVYERQWSGALPSWQANFRAIMLGLKALRAVDRYGITHRGEQFTGFKAITAGVTAIGQSVMDPEIAMKVISDESGYSIDSLQDPAVLKDAIRKAKRLTHPDVYKGDGEPWNAVAAAADALKAGNDG